jgi:GntR family transcriptional regulator
MEHAIADGILPPGMPLPPEREIAKITGLSRVTVRKAIAPLVENGLVEQRQGSGSIIAGPVQRVEQSLSRLTSFTEDMKLRGLETASKWLNRAISDPTPEEIMNLNISTSEAVAKIDRLRFANDTPMAIERATLPLNILNDPLGVDESLYKTLEKLGKKPVRAIQHLKASNIKKEDALLLNCDEGTACLNVTRLSFLESGTVVEFTKSIYRGDAYDFVAELRIPGNS